MYEFVVHQISVYKIVVYRILVTQIQMYQILVKISKNDQIHMSQISVYRILKW